MTVVLERSKSLGLITLMVLISVCREDLVVERGWMCGALTQAAGEGVEGWR